MSFNEVREILTVQLEDPALIPETELIKNFIHCFQSDLSLEDIGFQLDLSKAQHRKEQDVQNSIHKRIDPFSLNMIFAVKHFNNQKIDSHLYFFRGFCQELNPDYCLLLDIGTQAKPESISKLVEVMDCKGEVGGVCGDLEVDLTGQGLNVLGYA